MSRITELERRRFLSLFWCLVGFPFWGSAQWFSSLSSGYSLLIITGLSLLGATVWIYHMVRMVLLKREMSDRERMQMKDERFEKNRRRSCAVGFLAMIVTTVPLHFVETAFTVATAAHLMLLIGVESMVGAFLYFESEGLSTIFSAHASEVPHE